MQYELKNLKIILQGVQKLTSKTEENEKFKYIQSKILTIQILSLSSPLQYFLKLIELKKTIKEYKEFIYREVLNLKQELQEILSCSNYSDSNGQLAELLIDFYKTLEFNEKDFTILKGKYEKILELLKEPAKNIEKNDFVEYLKIMETNGELENEVPVSDINYSEIIQLPNIAMDELKSKLKLHTNKIIYKSIDNNGLVTTSSSSSFSNPVALTNPFPEQNLPQVNIFNLQPFCLKEFTKFSTLKTILLEGDGEIEES